MDSFITWGNEEEKKKALNETKDNIKSYDGMLSSTASRRSFLDIEPNISVRPEFSRNDYYRFRPMENPEGNAKFIIEMSMEAYNKVGIIKNIIDLMGDFGSQGITISHTNKAIERFCRKWWEQVKGEERSERFLNLLYRTGNVFIHKRFGKITRKIQKEMAKAAIEKKVIPFGYDFLNPLAIEVNGDFAGIFAGGIKYKMKLSTNTSKALGSPSNLAVVEELPDYIRDSIKKNANYVELPSDRLEVFFYKKDDWQLWANPMIHAILDDINMLEKMKLADMSALDGAISNIRLWKLGNLEHKILPQRGAIDRLRNILASNVGGGTMDLVWGPEISFEESNSQIYKFLGMEKYNPVLSSIYGGMGIPPTLTGMSGQSGGFTNNFISLKTLIERLEYGRSLLQQFWMKELQHLQKAMDFPSPPEIHFDHMVLSDEAAEKNLLIQMADRNIISIETLRERMGESNKIEDSRIKTEYTKRKKRKMPPKADPYHKPDIESEFIKIALNKDTLSIEDVTEYKARKPPVQEKTGIPSKNPAKTPQDNGRPLLKKDSAPRKQKRVLPRSKADITSILLWSGEAQKTIASIMNPILLALYEKKTLRDLSKEQLDEFELIKFKVLCGIEPETHINEETVLAAMEDKVELPNYKAIYNDFVSKNNRVPNIQELRNIYALSYSLSFF